MSSTGDFPVVASQYDLNGQIGQGASAKVYLGSVKGYPEKKCVIKIVNLEENPEDASRKEIQVMGLNHHENLVDYYASFVSESDLWIIMEYCCGGSYLDIMKYSYPDGLPESMIATALKDALKGLEYIHKTGRIHRDIKAGNILLGSKGISMIGDFGVTAWLLENGQRRGRETFVGTPCWMAPEVMEQSSPYDELADIWSLGITALEMAYGRAPYAAYPPMKVLMMVLSKPPPSIQKADLENKRFSKDFDDFIKCCLQKESSKRYSATKLLDHKFITKHAKKAEWMKENLVEKLPTLQQRFEKTCKKMDLPVPPESKKAEDAAEWTY